jgi:hypothetical protein
VVVVDRAGGSGHVQSLTRSLPLVSPCGFRWCGISPELSPAPVVIDDRAVDAGEGIVLACRGEVGGGVGKGSDHRGHTIKQRWEMAIKIIRDREGKRRATGARLLANVEPSSTPSSKDAASILGSFSLHPWVTSL